MILILIPDARNAYASTMMLRRARQAAPRAQARETRAEARAAGPRCARTSLPVSVCPRSCVRAAMPLGEEAVLDETVVRRMAIAKVFRDNVENVNSMDMDNTGEFLVTASDDESIHLYNCWNGEGTKTLFSKKYGCDLVRFTHTEKAIICASKNGHENSLRYLSLHDNRYLRYFAGHRDRVMSLAMNPQDDTFASASVDGSVRLWDLRSSTCAGVMRLKESIQVAYDPQGVVLAMACSSDGIVRLYDPRAFDSGPFDMIPAPHPQTTPLEWRSLKFSSDGKYMLLAAQTGLLVLLDAYTGVVLQSYNTSVPPNCQVLEPCFTPDTQFVLAGSAGGRVQVFHRESGRVAATWTGHTVFPAIVVWNPHAMMAASAGHNAVAFWLPSNAEAQARMAVGTGVPASQPMRGY